MTGSYDQRERAWHGLFEVFFCGPRALWLFSHSVITVIDPSTGALTTSDQRQWQSGERTDTGSGTGVSQDKIYTAPPQSLIPPVPPLLRPTT